MSYANCLTAARAAHLDIFGAFHPDPSQGAPAGCATLLMLGPHEPGFWPAFSSAPEYRDDQPDPLDRWSKRVIGALAADWGGQALFPSDGPPYPPFIAWARASGRAWPSPVGLLVHDRAGLMVSYRGAVALPRRLRLPAPGQPPCPDCADKPCLAACPVSALAADHPYGVAACQAYLHTAAGQDCMSQGCQVRRACPLSTSYGRLPAQSAFHMKAFCPS